MLGKLKKGKFFLGLPRSSGRFLMGRGSKPGFYVAHCDSFFRAGSNPILDCRSVLFNLFFCGIPFTIFQELRIPSNV